HRAPPGRNRRGLWFVVPPLGGFRPQPSKGGTTNQRPAELHALPYRNRPSLPTSGTLSFPAAPVLLLLEMHGSPAREETALGQPMSFTAAIRLALAALLVHKGRSA